jgi:hypothetical protein
MATQIEDVQAQTSEAPSEAFEMPQPRPEHAWLQKLVGEWVYEMEADMGDGQPPHKVTGTESVRPVGDFFIVAEGTGCSPGGTPSTMTMTLGFDPMQGGYVGTWYGSMMTYLWVYKGSMDADQRVLTLASDGPSMAGDGTLAKYQDIITIVSDNERVLTGNFLGEDGQWTQMMKMTFRRA